MSAPFRINYRDTNCQRCHETKPGNGVLCDDCWWTVMFSIPVSHVMKASKREGDEQLTLFEES